MSDAAVIDRATDGDLAGMLVLLTEMADQHEAYDPFYARGADWVERTQRYLRERLASPEDYLAVARVGHEVIGFVSAAVRDTPLFADPCRGVIENLAVAPLWRRHGLGTRLFAAALAWCHAAGATRVQLAAAWDNEEGRRFWEHCGFEPVFVWMQRPTQ